LLEVVEEPEELFVRPHASTLARRPPARPASSTPINRWWCDQMKRL
jgi:hypothetical protein